MCQALRFGETCLKIIDPSCMAGHLSPVHFLLSKSSLIIEDKPLSLNKAILKVKAHDRNLSIRRWGPGRGCYGTYQRPWKHDIKNIECIAPHWPCCWNGVLHKLASVYILVAGSQGIHACAEVQDETP